MKTLWDAWLQRFDALAGRERRLIGVALLGGIVLLGWSLGVDPALTRLRVAERGLADLAVQRPALQAQMAALQAPGLQPETQARPSCKACSRNLRVSTNALSRSRAPWCRRSASRPCSRK